MLGGKEIYRKVKRKGNTDRRGNTPRDIRAVLRIQPDTSLCPPVILFAGSTAPHFLLVEPVFASLKDQPKASTLVTVHANRRVIRVPAHAAVTGIRARLIRVRRIPRVASVDAREDCVIRGIDMAVATTRTIVWNSEGCVVEDRSQPGGRYPSGVAGNASGWIGCDDVIRHVRSVRLCIREIALVAAVAIRRWIARCVVAANVAVRAGVHHRSDCAGNRSAWRQHMRPL